MVRVARVAPAVLGRAIMMPMDGEPMADDERETIAVLADALRDKFGERAAAIARAQADSADGPARRTWLAIVEHLAAR